MKNKKAGRRSAPHVGENGGLFRYIGAYVAFASFVYHSLVVLVIAFTESFGYACVAKNEGGIREFILAICSVAARRWRLCQHRTSRDGQ